MRLPVPIYFDLKINSAKKYKTTAVIKQQLYSKILTNKVQMFT